MHSLEFHCSIDHEGDIDGVTGISPIISGRAWVIGMVDPSDPFQGGYRVTDTWPMDKTGVGLMPIVNIELFPGRSAEKKGERAKAITDKLDRVGGFKPEATGRTLVRSVRAVRCDVIHTMSRSV